MIVYWAEPERAPHKRYSCARIVYYGMSVTHLALRIQCTGPACNVLRCKVHARKNNATTIITLCCNTVCVMQYFTRCVCSYTYTQMRTTLSYWTVSLRTYSRPPSLHSDATVHVSYAMLYTLTLTHTRTIAT